MYQLTDTTVVIRTAADGTISFPADPANTDYAEYLEWLAEGNTPDPYVPPPPPPVTSVTPRQARLALLSAGLLEAAQAAVDASGPATKITWEYASVFEREDPLIIGIGAGLGLTSEQIDALFTQAATIS